jgi:hypothetical protein
MPLSRDNLRMVGNPEVMCRHARLGCVRLLIYSKPIFLRGFRSEESALRPPLLAVL